MMRDARNEPPRHELRASQASQLPADRQPVSNASATQTLLLSCVSEQWRGAGPIVSALWAFIGILALLAKLRQS